jgi:hypothetical protein
MEILLNVFAFLNVQKKQIHVVKFVLIVMKHGQAIVKFIEIVASVIQMMLVAAIQRTHTFTLIITENVRKYR